MEFCKIWNNIMNHELETFYTLQGCECSYEYHDTYLKLLDTNRNIPKWQIEEACKLNNPRPKDLKKFMAPSYIVAIITDKRIIG